MESAVGDWDQREGPLRGPGPETRFPRRRRLFGIGIGDQATAGGVSMLRLSICFDSPHLAPFLGSSLAVLADTSCVYYVSGPYMCYLNADTRSAGEIGPLHALVAAVV